jgi:hypothetical protein
MIIQLSLLAFTSLSSVQPCFSSRAEKREAHLGGHVLKERARALDAFGKLGHVWISAWVTVERRLVG